MNGFVVYLLIIYMLVTVLSFYYGEIYNNDRLIEFSAILIILGLTIMTGITSN